MPHEWNEVMASMRAHKREISPHNKGPYCQPEDDEILVPEELNYSLGTNADELRKRP
jgi:hypothetical protein